MVVVAVVVVAAAVHDPESSHDMAAVLDPAAAFELEVVVRELELVVHELAASHRGEADRKIC